MSVLLQSAEGIAVVLSLAVFLTARPRIAAALCTSQTAIAGVAVALHSVWAAVILLAFAASIPLAARRFPIDADDIHPTAWCFGGGLALLALTAPGDHLALAVTLLGVATTAVRRSAAMQMCGLILLQNGAALAAAKGVVLPADIAIAALPVVPAIGAGGFWLNATHYGRAIRVALSFNRWIDAIGCTAMLACAGLLPWLAPLQATGMHVDALAATLILLLTMVAAAASWAPQPDAGEAAPAGARLVLVLGATLAIALVDPLWSWLALTAAAVAAAAQVLARPAEAWRRLCLASLGLGIALFGTAATAGANAWAPACTVAGLGAVACLAPELAFASVALIIRQLAPLAAHAPTHALLLCAGLAGMAIAGCGMRRRAENLRLDWPSSVGHAGVALFAFGLGTQAADFAALVQLVLMGLTQSSRLLSRAGGVTRMAATAGLAGVPPFGMFPGLALIVAATAADRPWMLLPLAAGLGLLGGSMLRQLAGMSAANTLPSDRYAWVPLALALWVGFAMPQQVVAWLQAAAAGGP